jgi:hypothetical protein
VVNVGGLQRKPGEIAQLVQKRVNEADGHPGRHKVVPGYTIPLHPPAEAREGGLLHWSD